MRATLLGLPQPGQEHLLAGLRERYLDDVSSLWASRPGDIAQTVAEGLFPSWSVDEETAERFGAVADDTSRPTALRRILAEQVADLRRALRARRADAEAQAASESR